MRSIVEILGKSYKGTIIEDPILEPYFIQNVAGSFTVSKKREDQNGALKYGDIGYYSTFTGCLNCIAKEKQHEEGKVYSSLEDYISSWKKVSEMILNAGKVWNMVKI